jgi:hypothetical protein
MRTRSPLAVAVLFLGVVALAAPPTTDTPAATREAAEKALVRAGANRPELEKALRDAPAEQRPGMEFLIANMPESDLKALHADFLLENLHLAYQAKAKVAWGEKVPIEIFLNNVLPYANLNESRDPWRKELYDLCLPLVKDCKTPGDAAQVLNRTVFEKLKVKYSTARKRADQGPKASIESGLASCTGLSILLSDACRSVCIPTRVVGTPLWANKTGNHTWVEIWDGDWHFTGACEADPQGLDRGWFVGNASQAQKDSREHAIYAASFKKTDTTFPLVWAPKRSDVYAENVTDRYTAKGASRSDKVRVSVRVWAPGKGDRVVAPVEVMEVAGEKGVVSGESKGATADRNDVLGFDLVPGREYTIRVGKPVRIEKTVKPEPGKELIVEIELPAPRSE